MSVDKFRLIVEQIARSEASQEVCFGHGSYGVKCRFCGGHDYGRATVQHPDSCPWIAARALCDGCVSDE